MASRHQLLYAARKLQSTAEELRQGLPHLYGWNWYEWAHSFFESTNKINLLCAANQISKSSTAIRKCIHWATSPSMWKKLWATKPTQFWYLYPNKDTATQEFETKWLPEFLPRHKFKDHELYGWKEKYEDGKIHSIEFNSGVVVYFKTYAQNVQNLQSGTVYAIFCDEEVPEEYYDELMQRLSATDGYFHMVFTPTRNQPLWYRAMECIGTEIEFLPDAWKRTVSKYDCQVYMDGTPGPWTTKRIKIEESRCKSQTEIDRRINGRFVTEEGRIYPTFEMNRHLIPARPVQAGWNIYASVDIGSGGPKGHPAAILFLMVRPDMQYGEIFRGWRGDGILTTSGDILDKYRELREALNVSIQSYDFESKDFEIVASRQGESFIKAEKKHGMGEDLVNLLFKNDMLRIHDTVELRKLASELLGLMKDTDKRHAKDDLCDALRYVVQVPWDFSVINTMDKSREPAPVEKEPETDEEWAAYHARQRRGEAFKDARGENEREFEEEIDFWNKQYGSDE